MKSLLRTAAVAITGATALSMPFVAPAVSASGGPSFIHSALPPPPAGSTSKNNQAAEPQIRADRAGDFYIF